MAKKNKPRDILLTGFPSFVARRVLSTILEKEPQSTVRCLVRDEAVDEAMRQLESMGAPESVTVLPGDVVAMDLGLSGTEYLEIVERVTDIYHVASIWWLGVHRSAIREANVLGARNVIDAAFEIKNLNRLNHFSTAFVAGDRTGVIMEDDLQNNQKFRNEYEKTKFEAEVMMRDAMNHIPVSVYRPTIIVGDSKTGVIDKMAGPYYIINAMMFMPANLPVLMPGKGDKPLNLVPIDFVTEAMYEISTRDDTAGKTFHLADPNPLSARLVFDLIAEVAGRPAPVGNMPYRLTRALMRLPYIEKTMRGQRQFLEELNQLSIYNSINTTSMLSRKLNCPSFPSYARRLVEYVKSTEHSVDFEMPMPGEILG